MELGKTTAYLDFNIKKIPVDIFELVKWISEPQPWGFTSSVLPSNASQPYVNGQIWYNVESINYITIFQLDSSSDLTQFWWKPGRISKKRVL